jgi:hypothetical protein
MTDAEGTVEGWRCGLYIRGRRVRVAPAMFCCGSPSELRSWSICVLRLAGNSRSISNEARSASPISRTIARLCEWSMSMELRMTAFSLRKTPLEPDIKVERPLQFCRRSNGDRRLWLSCASACVLEQRVQLGLWLSRDMRHRWTAGDGLVDKIIGDDIRSRILTDIQISLGNRELPGTMARGKDVLREVRP